MLVQNYLSHRLRIKNWITIHDECTIMIITIIYTLSVPLYSPVLSALSLTTLICASPINISTHYYSVISSEDLFTRYSVKIKSKEHLFHFDDDCLRLCIITLMVLENPWKNGPNWRCHQFQSVSYDCYNINAYFCFTLQFSSAMDLKSLRKELLLELFRGLYAFWGSL